MLTTGSRLTLEVFVVVLLLALPVPLCGIPHLPVRSSSTYRQVQFEEAHQYSEDNGLIHMETSAKSALNVKSIFVEIGELFYSAPLYGVFEFL